MLNVTSDVITSPNVLFDLWKHECSRVISDRFVNEQDSDWFMKTMKQMVEEEFGNEAAKNLHSEPYFVDFLRDAPELTGFYCI